MNDVVHSSHFFHWLSALWRRSRIPVIASSLASCKIGHSGERLARKFLKKSGYFIVSCNCLVGHEEIDIIAIDPARDCVVFVEVRTRSSSATVAPYFSITKEKRRHLARAMRRYQRRYVCPGAACRFDIITITYDQHFHDHTLHHLQNVEVMPSKK